MLPALAVGVSCLLLAGPAALPAQQAPAPPASDAPFVAAPAAATRASTDRAAAIEARLAADRGIEATWLKGVAVALAADTPRLAELQAQVAAVFRARGERLHHLDPGWPAERVEAYASLLLVDPRRFTYDMDFRANVVPVLRDGIAPVVPVAARERLLRRLNAMASFSFAISEKVEVAWGLARRASRDREVLFEPWDHQLGGTGAIEASFYSMVSPFVTEDEAVAFLRAMQELAPERDIVVLSDAPLIERLRPLTGEMNLHLIDSLARRYTPWPRDPFKVVRSPDGGATFLVRPNIQARREGDVFMAREILQGLPDELDAAWGETRWMLAPMPFHGGQMLVTPGTTWVSVYTLFPRIVELMPVAPTLRTLQEPDSWRAFVEAIDIAVLELESTFGINVRFVHDVPTPEGGRPLTELTDFEVVLRGAGLFDLDSVVTIVPGPDRASTALVADVTLGTRLLSDAPDEEVEALGATYRLEPTGDRLRRDLVEHQDTPENRHLDAFLDSTARFLERQGMEVRRLPLLHVADALLREDLRVGGEGFLVTWNNVVLEIDGGRASAEGFASGGLVSADEAARRAFDEAGLELRLAPPFALGVIRGGGYRCASNHLRALPPHAAAH